MLEKARGLLVSARALFALDGGAPTRLGQRYPAALGDELARVFRNVLLCKGRVGYMFDIFSGAAGVGVSCDKLGIPAVAFDTSLRTADDVNSLQFLRFFRRACAIGDVTCLHLAPPCSSFSLAQSRSGRAVRSAEKPWGLDN